MTDAEQREAARHFVNKWRGRGNEDEDGRSYWIDLLHNVLGMENVTDRDSWCYALKTGLNVL